MIGNDKLPERQIWSESAASEPTYGRSEYLCYRLLVGLERSRCSAVSRSKFHKLSCITDRYLLSELGHDVGFPRYWYIYGEVMDEQSIARGFYRAPAAKFWAGQQYVPADDVADWEFAVPEAEKDRIDEAVRWTVNRFEQWSAADIQRYQYREFVPNQFIRAYSTLRAQLQDVDLDTQYTLGDFSATPRSTEEFVEDCLDEMVRSYPREDYPEMYDLFLRWDETVRLLLDGTPNYRGIEELLESFVRTLSKVELRFHHRQNIADARIREWENDRLEVKSEFRSRLAAKHEELLAARERR